MAKRSKLVLPDVAIRTVQGDMEVVSRDALVSALLDMAAVLDVSGGVLTVMPAQRLPTGAPNEMVTTAWVLEWKDRTDAKPQPEAEVDLLAPPVPQASPADVDAALAGLPPEVREALMHTLAAPAPVPAPAAAGGNTALPPINDGLNEADLPEEDLDSIPPEMR